MKTKFVEIISLGYYIDSVKFNVENKTLITSIYQYNGKHYLLQCLTGEDGTEVTMVKPINSRIEVEDDEN